MRPRSDHPNIHDAGLAIGLLSFRASTPLTLRTSDQMNHQSKTRTPMTTTSQHDTDRQIQYADPERADLELVMRAQQRIGIADFDVRDDDADQPCYAGEVGGEIEDIDDQRELRVGHRGLLRRIRLGRLTCVPPTMDSREAAIVPRPHHVRGNARVMPGVSHASGGYRLGRGGAPLAAAGPERRTKYAAARDGVRHGHQIRPPDRRPASPRSRPRPSAAAPPRSHHPPAPQPQGRMGAAPGARERAHHRRPDLAAVPGRRRRARACRSPRCRASSGSRSTRRCARPSAPPSSSIPCLALFPYTDPKLRDEDGSEALNPDNLVCRAIRAIKKEVPRGRRALRRRARSLYQPRP